MSFLNRYFGSEEKFLALLQAGAAEATISTGILAGLLKQPGNPFLDDLVDKLAQTRRKHKRISQEITELLCQRSFAPLDREDIAALSTALYKITKTVEKVGERVTVRPFDADLNTLTPQVSLLGQGANIVAKMVEALQARSRSAEIRDLFERLQAIEGEADHVMNELLQVLYSGDVDPRLMVFWKDLYELLEKAIDRCRDAGHVVFRVILKTA